MARRKSPQRASKTLERGIGLGHRLIPLLRRVGRTGNLRAAARALGMDPGNALRLIRTSEDRLGCKLVRSVVGGRGGGGSRLTAEGRRLARRRIEGNPLSSTRWPCEISTKPIRGEPLLVRVPGAWVEAQVAALSNSRPWDPTSLRPGEGLELEIPPSAVTLLEPTGVGVRSSARNLWAGRVMRIRPGGPWGIRLVEVKVGTARLRAALTIPAVKELRLRKRSRVVVQIKATALRLRRRRL